MIRKAGMSWSAQQLFNQMSKGRINFDIAVQRGLVWDKERKSLLIHSMLEGYPIPTFFAVKNSEGGYDMLDGKQRSNTIYEYMNDGFTLSEDMPNIIDEDGVEYFLSGVKFSGLAENLQQIIKDYSLSINYFDDITDEEVTEMFFRLNNGKPLTAIELTRVRAKSVDTIRGLAKHDFFNETMSEKAIEKFKPEEIVIQCYLAITEENPSFLTKHIRPIIETKEITEEQKEQLTNAFDRFLEVYNIIAKEDLKIAKKIAKKTHIPPIVKAILKSLENEVNAEKFAGWLMKFFDGGKGTVSDIYNSTTGAGSAKAENVTKRINAILESYDENMK